MNEADFRAFLKRNRRKKSAIEQIVQFVTAYETYFVSRYPGKQIDQTTIESLESYVSWLESESGSKASKPLWGLRYYFDFIENKELSDLAGQMRSERIKRKPFMIKSFRGVNPEHIERLLALYIENIDQMLDEARTSKLRQNLAKRTGIPPEGILELVKLCDLARLGGVRTVRARLYHDAGLTPAIIATWDPDELCAMLVLWVDKTDFDGIAPQLKEVQHLVNNAKTLPLLVQYEHTG